LECFPVHRLDQYTSGVFCIACNAEARAELIEQLKAHTMRREYVAFVEGRAPTPRGTWRHWLRLSQDELRQNIVSEAEAKTAMARNSEVKEAITHYEVIAEFGLGDGQGFATKLRLRLETGRKHQIRAQAAHAGLPLIGDRTYHPKHRRPIATVSVLDFPRQALHAEVLELEHPERRGTRLRWKAEMPKDLRQLEAGLRASKR
jgi:23S rRNA pseudouridine1911/1915/1917 synthase